MKLNCLIVDDEPIACKILEEFIADIEFLLLAGNVQNPVKAASFLNENQVDLVFLDINMPRMNGIEFLKNSKSLPPVIITTAYPEYAVEGFNLDVLDYLVKPIAFDRFLKACKKAKQHFEWKEKDAIKDVTGDHFFIKSEKNIEKVFYDDLLYVEGLLNYILLHTIHRKMIVYMTIKSMLDQLPPETFIKVHKSYVVNSKKIRSIEGNILKIGDTSIAISQNLRAEVMDKILKDKLIKR